MASPVVVIGGSLAGMAAAVRLAKAGHPVVLLEDQDHLGGAWGGFESEGVRVDRMPSVLGFPAPWRDLFRKSGRTMDAELARSGTELIAAPPAAHRFDDDTSLTLPSDRGDQASTITEAYGPTAAAAWRDLVDDLDRLWQQVRPLGLESELRNKSQLSRPIRDALWSRRTIEDLARSIGEDHLAEIVRLVAHRLGSEPKRTPAWCAVQLSVDRTFGRWTVQSGSEQGRSSILVDALADRLRTRKVDVRLATRATKINISEGRAASVSTATGDVIDAAAVICAVDPWQVYGDLVPANRVRREARAAAKSVPALAPEIRFAVGDPVTEVTETITHGGPGGRPTIEYRRPAGEVSVLATHDYATASPTPHAGIGWDGFRSWLRRPPITSQLHGLFLTGPYSRGGAGLSQTILSGALASYSCHDSLAFGAGPRW